MRIGNAIVAMAAVAALAACASGGRDNDAQVLTDRSECQTSQAVEDAQLGVREAVDPRCRPPDDSIWSSGGNRRSEPLDFRRGSGDD